MKMVPDEEARISLKEGTPNIGNIGRTVNAFDRYALEMALRFCEESGGEVTVVTLEDAAEARKGLELLLAAGAGHAYVGSPIRGDEAATAEALKQLLEGIRERGAAYDLILCGKESTDEASSQVGTILAEKMNLPLVTNVVHFEPSIEGLAAQKETEEGYELYKVSLPAVFTVAGAGHELRYPSIKGKLAAKKAEIPVFSIPSGETAVRCMGYEERKKPRAGIRIKKENEAEAVAVAMELLEAEGFWGDR